jgi:chorismate dehydratase
MSRLRISAISYLNTAPLMWDFENGIAADFDISYTLPSACAAALRDGTADIGIIPAAAYASIPGLVILPDVAIAARSAVRSILLVSKVPIDQIRTVALDTSSMTSVALTKVLFAKWLGGARQYSNVSPDLDQMLLLNDAALLIGDPALQVDRAKYATLDLAEEWNRHTGKSFVFAFWAVRESSVRNAEHAAELARIFQASRDHGLQNLPVIAHQWARRIPLTERDVIAYLTENIHFDLDADALEGLQLYFRYASEIGALPAVPDLRFAQAPNRQASNF